MLSHLSNHATQINKPISAQQTTDRVTTGKGPRELRRAQHHPSAQGRGLPRKGGGRADQEASSSGKEQRVEVVDFGSNMGEHVRGSESVALTVGVHRHWVAVGRYREAVEGPCTVQGEASGPCLEKGT